MLQRFRVTTMLPVVEMSRARAFYEQQLGLKATEERPDGKVVYDCAGSLLALFPRGTPTKAEHTAISFEVPDVEKMVRDLTARGVSFEDYDFPGLKTQNKVCVLGSERAAWFKDSEGNLLCVHQPL